MAKKDCMFQYSVTTGNILRDYRIVEDTGLITRKEAEELWHKFKDGTIRYGIYNGTVDVYWPYLFNTAEEAWDAWHKFYRSTPAEVPHRFSPKLTGGIEDVEIADDYGSGDTYIGRATKDQICSDCDIDNMIKIGEGLPDWWAN